MKTWQVTCPMEFPYIKATSREIRNQAPVNMILTAKEIGRMLIAFPRGTLQSREFTMTWRSIHGTNGTFIEVEIAVEPS